MNRILFIYMLFTTCFGFAQNIYDWGSNAPDGNWRQGASGARWFGPGCGGCFDEPGDFGILRFNNNSQLSMNNNVPSVYSMHQIVFGSFNTNDRTISGNTVRLYDFGSNDPKVENNSTANHTINFNLEGDGDANDPLEINPLEGNLTFNGTIDNKGANIRIFGNNNKILFLNGIVLGSGGFLNEGNNTVALTAQNTYTGLTTLNAGILQLNRIGGATLPSANEVTINIGATLRISENQVLSTINCNGGTLVVDAGVVLTLNTLNATNGSTISGNGTVRVLDVLNVVSGTFTSNNNIVLVSNATNTARVTPVTGTISGEITVERYISGRRAFRFVTPGVTTTTSVFHNWQNSGATTAGIGTQISGDSGATNGFDTTATNNPSLFTYDAQATGTTSGFTAVSNTTTTTLSAGVGYRILVRGDRNVDLTAASSANMNVPTTLSAKGTLTTGTVVFNAVAGSPVLVNNNPTNTQTNGYTLIGNPYASPVDWDAVTKSGVQNNAYYTWDPTLGTLAQRGRYVVYSSDTQSTNLLDDNSVLSQTNRRFLQSGQAVFIKNANLTTPATLTFNENNKATTTAYVFKSANQAAATNATSKLYLSVYEPNELAVNGAAIDGALALFGTNYASALDANDVEKLVASGENIAFARNNKNLAIETLAPVTTTEELFVKTIAFQPNKSYTFKVTTSNLDATTHAKLVDMYFNTETILDVTQPNFVTFATTTDANSFGLDRFKIVFHNAALGSDFFASSSVSVYPNPISNNQFTIAMPATAGGTVALRMHNLLGQEVYATTAEASSRITIAPKKSLENGIYILSIETQDKTEQIKVIVKK